MRLCDPDPDKFAPRPPLADPASRRSRTRLIAAALLVLLSLSTTGCYYTHLARGQFALLWSRRSSEDVLRDPDTPPEVADALRHVATVLDFARELGLRVDGQYESYAAWPGDRILTTVVRVRKDELDAYPFWFPLIGAAPYKGFFDRDRAEREARTLREAGYEVCVSPVRAYSTLGWFDDPLTQPMLKLSQGRLTEVILHELVHATVFAPGDATFNEGLATFFGQEAAIRFRVRTGDGERARREVREARTLSQLLANFRTEVRELYEGAPAGALRTERRSALEAALRGEIAALQDTLLDTKRYAREVDLNNACLALAGTYEEDVPRYASLLERLEGDLGALLEIARAAAEKPEPRSHLFPEEDTAP